MKIPKERSTYCKKCKVHTKHKVSIAKRRGHGATHTMAHGQKPRVRARGLWRGFGNMGRYSRPPIASRKRSGKKQSKKTDLRYTCPTCKKTSTQSKGKRAKKVEFKQ